MTGPDVFILFLWISYVPKGGIATAEFNSKTTCIEAAQAVQKAFSGVEYVCVKK